MIELSPEANSDARRIRNYLRAKNPLAAKRAIATIWSALQALEQIPALGRPTEKPNIRQIVVPFGRSAYIVRCRVLSGSGTIFVIRIWHSREART